MWVDFVVKKRVDEIDFNYLNTLNKVNKMA